MNKNEKVEEDMLRHPHPTDHDRVPALLIYCRPDVLQEFYDKKRQKKKNVIEIGKEIEGFYD